MSPLPLGAVASSVRGDLDVPAQYANLDLWLKADALTLSNADPVSSWTDSSGQGNHAAQATSTRRPLYTASALNGLPGVTFDGTDDVLETACPVGGAAQTLFVVMKPTKSTHGRVFGGGMNAWGMTTDDQAHVGTAQVGFDYSAVSTAAYSTSAYNLWTATFVGGTTTGVLIRRDGVDCTGSKAGRGLSAGTGNVGNWWEGAWTPYWFQGVVVELIHYSAVRTLTEIQAVESYLTDKYAL